MRRNTEEDVRDSMYNLDIKRMNDGIEYKMRQGNNMLIHQEDIRDRESSYMYIGNNNPTKSVFRMDDGNDVTVYSIFRRNVEQCPGCADLPLIYAIKDEHYYRFGTSYYIKLFWFCFDAILDKFIQEFNNVVVVSFTNVKNYKSAIAVPYHQDINTIIAKKLQERADNVVVIEDSIVKLDSEEIYYTCLDKSSYFYKYWSKQNRFEEMIDNLDNEYLAEMTEFKIHKISNQELRQSIENTLKHNSENIENYKSVINDAHILVIDDTITHGRSFISTYNAIMSCYFPKSVTGLTMFSEKV